MPCESIPHKLVCTRLPATKAASAAGSPHVFSLVTAHRRSFAAEMQTVPGTCFWRIILFQPQEGAAPAAINALEMNRRGNQFARPRRRLPQPQIFDDDHLVPQQFHVGGKSGFARRVKSGSFLTGE